MAIVRNFGSVTPRLAEGIFLAENAVVVGDVEIAEDANIWYGTVIRGDVGRVSIGRRVNIQDMSCVHMTENLSEAILDDDVSIGHGVTIHGAIIGKGTLIGMGSVVMDNARVGENCLVGAGSLVTANTEIPDGMLAHGRPARVVRPLTEKELWVGRKTAEKYVKLGRIHAASAKLDWPR